MGMRFLLAILIMFIAGTAFAQEKKGFELRFVCQEISETCEQVVNPKTQETLYIERKIVLSNQDIDKAEVHMVQMPPGIPAEPRLHLYLTPEGKEQLADITTQNIRRNLGIFFNGEFLWAPTIAEPITGGELEVSSGSGDEQKINEIIAQFSDTLYKTPSE